MKLNEISLPARDLKLSIAFYRSLGLTLIVETEIYARFELTEGEATMSLHKAEATPAEEGIYVYFECTDLNERVKALKAKGIDFESEPKDQRWLWREAWLKDPAGNWLCLYRAGENRKNPPWRIKG